MSDTPPKPRYQELADRLTVGIQDGTYPPGTRLPSMSVVERWGYGRQVIQDAVAVLERQGLVEVRHGSGTWVLPSSTPPGAPAGWLEWRASMEARVAELERQLEERDVGPEGAE